VAKKLNHLHFVNTALITITMYIFQIDHSWPTNLKISFNFKHRKNSHEKKRSNTRMKSNNNTGMITDRTVTDCYYIWWSKKLRPFYLLNNSLRNKPTLLILVNEILRKIHTRLQICPDHLWNVAIMVPSKIPVVFQNKSSWAFAAMQLDKFSEH